MTLLNLIIPNNNNIEYQDSMINLKIKGPGKSDILSPSFNDNYRPSLIIINGIPKNYYSHNYRHNFNMEINTVELIWYNKIYDCESMFRQCSNITEIDFTNFDTSRVTSMSHMF